MAEIEVEADIQVEADVQADAEVEVEIDAPQIEVEIDAPEVEVEIDAPEVEVNVEAPEVEAEATLEIGGGALLEVPGDNKAQLIAKPEAEEQYHYHLEKPNLVCLV